MTYLSIAFGIVILLTGGELLVRHASRLALSIGISPLVVGLTIVAFGTSSPELMSSVYAQWIGEGSLAVGNAVGSNLFNLTGVLGLAGLVGDGGLEVTDSILWFDLPVMTATAIVCLPVFVTGGRIDRWEGGVFALYYLGYVTYLVLLTTGQPAANPFGQAMLWFVLPLTLLTLIVIGFQQRDE